MMLLQNMGSSKRTTEPVRDSITCARRAYLVGDVKITDLHEKCIFNAEYKAGLSTSADLFEDKDLFF